MCIVFHLCQESYQGHVTKEIYYSTCEYTLQTKGFKCSEATSNNITNMLVYFAIIYFSLQAWFFFIIILQIQTLI